MIIDRSDVSWVVAIIVIVVVAGALYVPYASSYPGGPSGGSGPGLIYGFMGTAMMLFAMLLTPRKKVPTLGVGRLYLWMKAHVWLGLLSFPIILFHAGFSLGGPLTTVMIIVFSIITLSGILGMILQQSVPRLMTEYLPMETIYEQIDHVLGQIRQEAEDRVGSFDPTKQEKKGKDEDNEGAAKPEEIAAYQTLREFYAREVEPFLHDHMPADSRLSSREKTKQLFDQMRKLLPDHLHQVLEDLHQMVLERRQLALQIRLHHLLHGWLFVHVPLSVVLLLLVTVHAIVAIRYI